MSIGVFVISCVKVTYLHVANTQTVWGGCDSYLDEGFTAKYMVCACGCADCSQVTLQAVWGGCNLIYNQLYYLPIKFTIDCLKRLWLFMNLWIFLHRYMLTNVACVQFYHCVLIFHFLLCFHGTFQWHVLCGTCPCCSLNGDTFYKMRF